MNRHSIKVLDEVVVGGTAAYTSIDDALTLASGRQIVLVARCTGMVGTPTLDVAIEHSSDGRRFAPKYTTPTIYMVKLDQPEPMIVFGSEGLTAPPNLKYVRLKVTLTLNASIALSATIRGSTVRPDAEVDVTSTDAARKAEHPLLSAPAGSLRRSHAASEELHALATDVANLPPSARAAHVLGNMSEKTREHFREVDRQILAMPAELRRTVMATTAQLIRSARSHAGSQWATQPDRKDGCCETGLGPED